jgi:hypothetical protein
VSIGFIIIAGTLAIVAGIWTWGIWGRDISEHVRVRLQQREHERRRDELVLDAKREIALEVARRERQEKRLRERRRAA